MSYILDALKKLENEKARKARSDGMVSISGALLQDKPRRPPALNAWKIATVAVVALSLIIFGVTWFVVRGDKRRSTPSPVPVVVQAPPVARVASPAPTSSPVAAVPPPAPAPARPVPAAPPPEPAKPRAVVSAPAPEDDDSRPAAKKQAVRQRKQRAQKTSPAVAAQPATPTLSAPPADIKVSGIAWQDERSARRAVVNGFLMREGGVVSGAKITEILRDRVRFSAGDRVFEAPLVMNGAAAPAPGK